MARELKQSTVTVVKIGPFVGTTGTVLTALSIVQADVRLSKVGGNMAQKSTATAAVHDELGVYFLDLSAADTGTLGELRLDIDKSGSAALSDWEIFDVVTANYWDTKHGTTRFGVDVQELDGGSAAAVNMLAMYDGTGYAGGTIKLVTGPTAGTITAGAPSAADIIGSGTAATNITAFFDGTGYTGGTSRLGVDVQEIDGGSAAAATFLTMYDGTGYAGGTIKLITTGGTVDTVAAGAISSSSFAADAIDADAIAGSALVAASFATGFLTAAKIAANAITDAKIAGSALTAAKLATGAITAAKIAGDAITAAKIADDAIAAEHIAGSAIVAATLATGTITSAKFAADAVDAAAIAGSALVAESFATGAITAAKIAADAITAAKIADDAIAAEHIAGSALVAASFATGTITAAKIAGSALGISNFDATYRMYVAEGIPKNKAHDLHVLMVKSSDHRTGITGLSTMTMTRTMGSTGSFVAGSASISEIGNGFYLAELTASDTNADVITYRFYCTADAADDSFIGVKTSA